MKGLLFILLLAGNSYGYAQQDFSSFDSQQKLEEISRKATADPEDDTFIQQLAFLGKHPLNLNAAGREELEALQVLDEIQISGFLTYRSMLGKLIDIHELQAVPGWNLQTIREILPFVSLSDPLSISDNLRGRLRRGEQSLLLRWGRILEKPAGYTKSPDTRSAYAGSAAKLYLRYQYRYKNLLQWGLGGDKDAGEQFFRGRQKSGFDAYSFHLFVRKLGIIKELALGDYSLNLGQGLIHWQGLSLGMGAGLAAAERQSPVLRPYSSPGEFSYQRGAGITVSRNRWELTAFFSSRKVDAHPDVSASGDAIITSFLMSGYHRTNTEELNRRRVRLQTIGSVAAYNAGPLHIALNAVHYDLSLPLEKSAETYNLFAPAGRSFTNASLSYSFTRGNVHLFGEVAADAQLHQAWLNGLVIALHRKVDLSVVHRSISREYSALFGNAFTQNAQPVNEQGIYTALTLRLSDVLTAEAYADVYRFPWLKYRINAPSQGKEFAVQIRYAPSKGVELVSRYHSSLKPGHQTGADSVMGIVVPELQAAWRVQLRMALNPVLTLEHRSEVVWYDDGRNAPEQGFLFFSDLSYKSPGSPVSGSARVQWVESDGYNSRVYAYEDNVLYGFSIPAFSGKGFRYYLNLRADLTRYIKGMRGWHLNCWMKWGQTIYPRRSSLGDGPDEIRGNHKSELTLQLIIQQSR